jgi:hypothetical protein
MGRDYVSELRPQTDLLFVPQIIYEHGEPRYSNIDRGKPLGEKPVPMPLYLLQIPYGLIQAWTRAFAVRGWWLTAWATCKFLVCYIIISKFLKKFQMIRIFVLKNYFVFRWRVLICWPGQQAVQVCTKELEVFARSCKCLSFVSLLILLLSRVLEISGEKTQGIHTYLNSVQSCPKQCMHQSAD